MMYCVGICSAKEQELILAPGLGDKKVKRLYQALHEPFRNVKQKLLNSGLKDVNVANKSSNSNDDDNNDNSINNTNYHSNYDINGSNNNYNNDNNSNSRSGSGSCSSSSGTALVQQSILINDNVSESSMRTVKAPDVDEKS